MLRFVVLLIAGFFAEQCRADVDCSEKPEINMLRYCCSMPLKLAQIFQKCEKEFPYENGIPNFCYHKCIFGAAGLVTNDVIEVAKGDTILTELYRFNPESTSIVKTIFKRCASKTLENQQHMLEKLEEHHIADDCNPVSLFLASCFFPEIIKNCPTRYWQNTNTCNQTRDYLTFCMQDYA